MPDENLKGLEDLKIEQNELYREESYTDLRMGQIRRLVPVKPDGSPDSGREDRFMGQTQILTGAGSLPIQAPLEAETMEQAIQEFPQAMRKAVEQMVEQVREVQREQAGRIVVPRPGAGGQPGQGPGQAGGPGGPGGIDVVH